MELRVAESDLEYIASSLSNKLSRLQNKSIFITGGTGFIGKWLLEALRFIDKKFELSLSVSVLTRDPDKFKTAYPRFAHIQYIEGDVRSFSFPDDSFDYIIHAATNASATLNIEDPMTMSEVICDGTKRVLQFATHNPGCRFLFLSSGAVYGEMPMNMSRFKEDFHGAPDPLIAGSTYGEAKRMAELYCATYARQQDVHVSIARCFAFVGPYLKLDTHFAIGNFIGNGLKNTPIIIHGDGKPLRSYLYTSDLIIWLLTILLNGENGVAYNVGSDDAYSIKEIATIVATFFPGLPVEILNQVHVTDRNQDYVPDLSKIKRELGVTIGVPLKDAIYKTIQFHQQ